jgi:hypothetical protein
MTPQLEFAVFGQLAAAAVGLVIVTLGALHSARFVVRLVLFLFRELRTEAQLLIDEIRPAAPPPPTGTTKPSATTPAAAHRSAS